MRQVSTSALRELKTLDVLNAGSIAKEDMFRGHVQFSLGYSLSENALDRKASQQAACTLAAKILAVFDESLVRIAGGGWASEKDGLLRRMGGRHTR